MKTRYRGSFLFLFFTGSSIIFEELAFWNQNIYLAFEQNKMCNEIYFAEAYSEPTKPSQISKMEFL